MNSFVTALLAAAFALQPIAAMAQANDAAIVRYNSRHHPVVDTDEIGRAHV